MPRPYTPVDKYTTQNERIKFHGVFERKKQLDDISKVRQHEICIQEPRVLVQRVLRGYGREKHESHKRIHQRTTKTRSRKRSAEYV